MSIEKNVVVENEVIEAEIVNPNEIVLSTGKKVTKRERRGQHHIVENRLLSACSLKILESDIKVAVEIWEIDGTKQKIPASLSEVYELAGEFTYEEWEELKIELQKDKKEMEEKAKNLQASIGSDSELM